MSYLQTFIKNLRFSATSSRKHHSRTCMTMKDDWDAHKVALLSSPPHAMNLMHGLKLVLISGRVLFACAAYRLTGLHIRKSHSFTHPSMAAVRNKSYDGAAWEEKLLGRFIARQCTGRLCASAICARTELQNHEVCFCLFATRLLVINKDEDLWARSNTVMLLSEPAATTVGDRISFNEAMHVIV